MAKLATLALVRKSPTVRSEMVEPEPIPEVAEGRSKISYQSSRDSRIKPSDPPELYGDVQKI